MAESPPVGQSAPATPAAPRVDIPALSIPCLKPVLHVSKHKICEEFSANDIDQLLHAIISANPYLAPCSQITNKWKEVTKIVQAEGACIGHDHETQEQGQESAHLGTGVSYFYFYFYSFLYISDWLTMYDRVAPTRNQHDLQWPMKLRRTWLFLHQSPAN